MVICHFTRAAAPKQSARFIADSLPSTLPQGLSNKALRTLDIVDMPSRDRALYLKHC